MIVSYIEDKIGIIKFKNKLNILSIEFIEHFNSIIKQYSLDHDVSVILIKSDEKVFSAGANLNELQQIQLGDVDFIDAWQRLSEVEKPVVACIEGPCLGGGFELALMCDLIYASRRATFGLPEVTLGLLPGGGGTQRLQQRISRSRALELILTGKSISADLAYEWGIVNEIFDDEICFDMVLTYCKSISKNSIHALSQIKKLIIYVESQSLNQNISIERGYFFDLLFKEDGKSGIEKFLNLKKLS